VSEVTEAVLLNDQLLGQSYILNRIGIRVAESTPDGALLDVTYGISEKSLDSGLYIWSMEDEVRFSRDNSGRYGDIPADQYLPSVRNVPLFPDRQISVGESWSAMAEEVHDLLPFFQVNFRLHIPFRVFYTYAGTELYEGRTVDILHINYHFLQDLDRFSLPPDVLPAGSQDLPERVSGDFRQVYLWDREAGIPAAVEEEFRITYTMSSGRRYTFTGNASGKVIEADQWEKETVLEKIEETIERENLEDISVRVNDDGVVMTLEDIHFMADSDELLPGEEDKLMELGEILKSFPGHDLLITGHTARVGSSTGQVLSEARAAAVARFFLETGVRSSTEMVVQGRGAREPLGDNATEEGRRRNRRVEITILDN